MVEAGVATGIATGIGANLLTSPILVLLKKIYDATEYAKVEKLMQEGEAYLAQKEVIQEVVHRRQPS